MTGIYYTDAADWLRSVGITVHEIAGWKTRARSSGGFPAATGALGIQWHHTASKTTPQNDTNWQFFTSPDRPIGNMLLDRNGEVWIGAAGAANTAGKGGPLKLSRGTLPVDGANARTWAIEAANDGVGEQWPTRQIDAYFTISNELNRHFGNQPTDIFNHHTWAPARKIDPAINTAVAGSWRPGASTTSGTWTQADVTAECARRATTPTPTPPPDTEDDMTEDELHRIVTDVLQQQIPEIVRAVWTFQVVDSADNVKRPIADIVRRATGRDVWNWSLPDAIRKGETMVAADMLRLARRDAHVAASQDTE